MFGKPPEAIRPTLETAAILCPDGRNTARRRFPHRQSRPPKPTAKADRQSRPPKPWTRKLPRGGAVGYDWLYGGGFGVHVPSGAMRDPEAMRFFNGLLRR